MLNFSPDQWIIVLLVFVLGLLVGGFLFTGGGRKWKTRYNQEVDRRVDLERTHSTREKEWREQDSLRGAAMKDRERDAVVDNRDEVVDRRSPVVDRRGPVVDRRDSDSDGVPDDRDPVDDRRR